MPEWLLRLLQEIERASTAGLGAGVQQMSDPNYIPPMGGMAMNPAVLRSVLGAGAPLESIMRGSAASRASDPNVMRSLGLGVPGGAGGGTSRALDANVLRSLGLDVPEAAAAFPNALQPPLLHVALRKLLAGLANNKGKLAIGGLGAAAVGPSITDKLGLTGRGGGNSAPPPGFSGNQFLDAFPRTGNPDSGAPQQPYDSFTEALIAAIQSARGNGDTASQRMNAEASMMSAESDKAYKAAQIAMQQGNAEEARRQFEIGQQWEQRAAQTSEFNAGTSRMNAQTNQFGAMTDVANSAEDIRNNNILGIGRGATNQTNLADIMGRIAEAQGKLGLEIASTPKNAIAGLMMSRGQNGALGGNYTPNNVLGFDPSSLQNMLNMAMQSSQQAMQMPTPQFDLQGVMAGLQAAAQGGAGFPGVSPGPPTDNVSGQLVQNRIPNNPPPPTNGYQSVLDRMRAGGAPDSAMQNFMQAAQSTGQQVR